MDSRRGVKESGLLTRRLAGILVMLAAGSPGAVAEERFAASRALAHVRVLSEEIGPRRTGTPQEAAGRDYIAREMAALGLSVHRLPVGRSGKAFVGSENVTGLLAGRSDDVILVGSHHDSWSRAVPGANDDASGVGVMLEAARVLAASPPAASVLFVAFCAEEDGLLGSRHFASHQDPGRIRVMINLDQVGQGDIFIAPVPGAPPLWASRALARAVREGPIAGVTFDPLHPLVARSIRIPFRADHMPFARRGVPAFTLTGLFGSWTYHTEHDTADRIEASSLEAAGRSLVGLVRRFDELVPGTGSWKDDTGYVVLPLPWRPVFVAEPAIHVMALMVLVVAFLWRRSVWRRAVRFGGRMKAQDAGRALLRAGLPLAGGVAAALLSEGVAEAVTGYRFSWMAHQGRHLASAALWFAAGAAAGGLMARRVDRPEEPEAYTILGSAWAAVVGAVFLVSGRPDLAFYMLVPSAAMLGAGAVNPNLTGAGALAGAVPLASLMRPESYRQGVDLMGLSIPATAAWLSAVTVAMPIALGVARSLPSSSRRFMRWVAGGAGAAGIVALAVCLAAPSYEASRRRVVEVGEKAGLARGRSGGEGITIRSWENLRGLETSRDDIGTIDLGATSLLLPFERDANPIGSLDVRIDIEPVEPLEGFDPRYLRDVRVLILPPAAVDTGRVTIRSTESFRLLDDGLWIPGTRFTRRQVFTKKDPSWVLRIWGRPGQPVEIRIEVETRRSLSGLVLTGDSTAFRWTSTLRWSESRAL